MEPRSDLRGGLLPAGIGGQQVLLQPGNQPVFGDQISFQFHDACRCSFSFT